MCWSVSLRVNMESSVSERPGWSLKPDSETGVSVFEQKLRVGRLLGPAELRSNTSRYTWWE